MTLSYLAHSNLSPKRSVGWSMSVFAVQLLVFELKMLEIFESEIRQNILDYQWMLGNCHDCSIWAYCLEKKEALLRKLNLCFQSFV